MLVVDLDSTGFVLENKTNLHMQERLSLYKSRRAKTHAIIQEEGHLIQKEPGISYIRRAIPNKEISIIYFISYHTHWESYHTNGSRGGLSCTTMAIIK